MAEETEISWCDHTWNPWRGCVKLSAGCAHCYAETLSKRNPAVLGVWGKDAARVEAVESYWLLPLRWHAAAVKAGEIRTVFVGSLMDVGEDRRDLDPLRDRMMAMIALTPLQRGEDGRLSGLRYLLLTKRPGALKRYLDAPGLYGRVLDAADWLRERRLALGNVPIDNPEHGHRAAWYPHLWIGASVEDQRAADERIPELLSIDCAGRFLSMEPLLGAVDLRHLPSGTAYNMRCLDALTAGRESATPWHLNWVIVGGESGPNARPMHPNWARDLRDQCVAAGVPFHFKQNGCFAEVRPADGVRGDQWMLPHGLVPFIPGDGQWYTAPLLRRVGKHAAGRLLDGQVHDAKPAVSQ